MRDLRKGHSVLEESTSAVNDQLLQSLEFFAPLNLPRLNSMIKDLYSQPV